MTMHECLTEEESQLVIGAIPLQALPDKWRYRETACSAEVIAGDVTLKPHWTGLLKPEVIKATMRHVIDDHRLAALVPELKEALRQLRDMFFEHAQAGAYVENGELVPIDSALHPWIPGARAPQAIAIIDAALKSKD